MLTDDDLTRELGDAFRAATQGLTYTGRRQPLGTMTTVLSTTAVAGVVAAAVAGVAVATAPRHSVILTKTMKLAGFSVTYSYPAGIPDPVFAKVITSGLPADVQAVSINRSDAHAWSGTDPETADTAVYVQHDPGGRLFALESATWSGQQLLDLVENHLAPVPAATN